MSFGEFIEAYAHVELKKINELQAQGNWDLETFIAGMMANESPNSKYFLFVFFYFNVFFQNVEAWESEVVMEPLQLGTKWGERVQWSHHLLKVELHQVMENEINTDIIKISIYNKKLNKSSKFV